MVRLCAGAIAVLSVVVAGGLFAAAAPDPVADNAALHYWRAFAVMPSLDDKQEASLRNAFEKPGPIDEKSAQLIGAGAASLKELRRGAARSRCVWGTPLEDGVDTLLPHCGKARQLTRLACARAELHFQQGRPGEAIADLTATMTLARHLAADEGIIISVLVDYAIERQAIGVAARHLGELRPAERADFSARLDRLPAATTMRRAIQLEKECLLEGFLRDLAGPNGTEKAASILKALSEGGDPNLKPSRDISPEQLRAALIALRPVYDRLAEMMDRPPAEMKTPEALLAGVSPPARALGLGLLPAVMGCRTSEAAHQTRLAMLKAALAAAGDGPEVLKAEAFRDPYAGGPFSYEKTAAGFRLVSKTRDRDGKPVALEVGQRP